MQEQIYTTWLPLVITALFAVVGLVRGAMREAIVAASVALAAFINWIWADQWGQGLFSIYTGMSQGQQEFILSLIVLWLIVLVVGYGLGATLPRQPLERGSRLGGALLGLASGAAVAGFTLRYAYANLDNAQESSRFFQVPVSYAFMVWAAWFPLVLAFVGAFVVLMGPLRRAQRAVARPSTTSDWAPSQHTGTGAPGVVPPYAPAPTMAASMFPPTVAPTSAANQTNTGFPAYVYGSPPPAARQEQDAPPTNLLPARPTQGAYGSEWAGAGDSNSQATRAFDTTPAAPAAPVTSTREAGAGATNVAEAQVEQEQTSTSTFGSTGGADSSWLMQTDMSEQRTEPWLNESGSGAPPVGESVSAAKVADGADADKGSAQGERKCPNCGSQVMPGAYFCTECGTRMP